MGYKLVTRFILSVTKLRHLVKKMTATCHNWPILSFLYAVASQKASCLTNYCMANCQKFRIKCHNTFSQQKDWSSFLYCLTLNMSLQYVTWCRMVDWMPIYEREETLTDFFGCWKSSTLICGCNILEKTWNFNLSYIIRSTNNTLVVLFFCFVGSSEFSNSQANPPQSLSSHHTNSHNNIINSFTALFYMIRVWKFSFHWSQFLYIYDLSYSCVITDDYERHTTQLR